MFDRREPYREGETDGYCGSPAYRAYYGDAEFAEYMNGHRAGEIARQADMIGFASFDD